MSDDQKVPDEPGTAEEKPPEGPAPETGHEPAAKKDQEETEQEPEEPSFLESIAADERDRRWRSESLQGLFGAPSAAGRDLIGQVSNRVSGGGSVNQIGGDLTLNVFDAARVEVSHLPRGAVDTLREYLVPPRSLKRLSEVVERKDLVFLRGPEGTGRTTAALAALLSWVRTTSPASSDEREERIGVIRGPGTVGRGSLPELRRGHGYLLDATNDDWMRDGDYLRDLVVKSECRLVVLVSRSRTNLPDTTVDHDPPPAIEVFHRRLEYEGRIAGIDPRLPAEVVKEITEDLDGESSPQRAVGQACEVVQGLKEGRSPEALLDELPKRLSDHIRGRLDQSQPIVGRCFMAGVAVLHDLPEVTVSRAALALADHIYEAWHIKKENRTPPTWEQLDAWLEYAGATAHRSTRPGVGRVVRLNRRNAPAATIRVLWEDHPTVREPLMRWLLDLGGYPDHAVQIKAAHAVGKLATLDFDTIRERFLTVWSDSRKSSEHRLAALALEAAAQEPRMAFRVRNHLRALAASNRHGPRAVAIQAYGSSIGADAIGEALQVLRRISTPLVIRLNRDAARSVVYLYSARTASTIVRELASWVDAGSHGGRHTAALAFIRLAAPASGAPDRPALTELDMIDELVLLWQNALALRLIPAGAERSRPAVPAAWGVLGEWVTRYDERPAAGTVIDQVIGTADTPSALLYLRLWQRRKLIPKDLYAHLIRLVKEG
jgi:hypothetical protein